MNLIVEAAVGSLHVAREVSSFMDVDRDYDWKRVAYLVHCSRALDRLEEQDLFPGRKIQTQFSSSGHELAQVLLGMQLDNRRDAASVYYRSRPFLLTVGLSVEDALAGPLAKSGGLSDGRDVGVVFNLPSRRGPTVLPGQGGVGAQYTPASGCAQAIAYYRSLHEDDSYHEAIAVSLGGDGSVATGGFWSALNIATTLGLPQLFFIEDNGYGISVPSRMQVPHGDIARNLRSYINLKVVEADGTDPGAASCAIKEMVKYVRRGYGPGLIRVKVPRLCGHSGQDSQSYKTAELLEAERANDPLPKLRSYLVPHHVSENEWTGVAAAAEEEVRRALERALARPEPNPAEVRRHVFFEGSDAEPIGTREFPSVVQQGANGSAVPPKRVNMVAGIRMTLEHELTVNPLLMVFGEDVGRKGGIHTATLGLQEKFGPHRVFDTSLSEEGIIGRAVGMAYAGLKPVAEIQFRKYADSAVEQLHDCGTVRWRTANRFAAPIVVRIPVGHGRSADLWHSECKEVAWAHSIGWHVAFPSNAEDAVGLLRTALRGQNPVIFCEHRAMLDALWARRNYPGDDYAVPFGKARTVTAGSALTVVTWGAMVERCEQAVEAFGGDVDLIDLRTLVPWDTAAVFASVRRTGRCLIVHEDNISAGFGAEIAARLAEELFAALRAPVVRVAFPDIPCPHNRGLFAAVVPDKAVILEKMTLLAGHSDAK